MTDNVSNETGLDIGHDAEYECPVCGGPEWIVPTHSGCRFCGSQDDVVPRGTVARRWQALRQAHPAEAALIERLHKSLDWRDPRVEMAFATARALMEYR